MDVSNINDALIKGVHQAQLEQAQLLSKLFGAKIGDAFLAQTGTVTKPSPEERAQLAEQIAKTLNQLNPNSAAPATKALINQLLSEQKIVQSSDLKLVNLTTQGIDRQVFNLLTYTDLPIEQDQPLIVKLDTNQRLVILGLLVKQSLSYGQLQSMTPQEIKQYLVPLQSQREATAANLVTNTLTNHHASVQKSVSPTVLSRQTLEALRTSINNLLPRKDLGDDLLDKVQWITRQIQKLPLQERNQWFSSELQQALKTLANHVRTPQELTRPTLLAASLRNSGVFFEQKLKELIPDPMQHRTTTPISSGGIKNEILTKLTNLGKSPLLTGDKSSGAVKSPDQLIKQDIKGALLSVLHNLEQDIEPLSTVTSEKTLSSSPLPALQIPLTQLFAQIMGMASANNPHKDLSPKELRAQLMMLLHQHTLGSLAKIQLQQLHALNHQLEQTDSPQPTQSWQFEIPLRHGQETHHLHLHWEYQWVDEENTKEKETPNKIKQWQVMLGFNMESIGQFYVQLILAGNTLSANFWAERLSTLEKTREKIDELQQQLEREGIQIKGMTCLSGLPPKPKMSLGYSLVDIKT